MNVLSQKAVTDFQAVYKKVHGKEISYDEAQRQGLRLLRLVQLVYRPIPKGEMKDEKTKRMAANT